MGYMIPPAYNLVAPDPNTSYLLWQQDQIQHGSPAYGLKVTAMTVASGWGGFVSPAENLRELSRQGGMVTVESDQGRIYSLVEAGRIVPRF